MKVYIASPFFNTEQIQLVKDIEHELDLCKIDYFSPRKEGIIKDDLRDKKSVNFKKIYESNISNIISCNVMIAVLDGSDTGTIFELGYATCLKCASKEKRQIITLTNINKQINVMLRECVDAHLFGVNKLKYLLIDILVNGKISNKYDKFPKNVT